MSGVLELEDHALQLLHGGRDLEELQDQRAIAEAGAVREHPQQRVGDVAGGAGHGDADRCGHGSSGRGAPAYPAPADCYTPATRSPRGDPIAMHLVLALLIDLAVAGPAPACDA